MEQLYFDFLSLVPDESKTFVDELNTFLTGKKCKRTIKPAAKGYLVTYDTRKIYEMLRYYESQGCRIIYLSDFLKLSSN